MSKFSRFLSIALTLSLLWGCGRISDLTYEKAAEFEGITFPPVSSQPAGTSSVPSGSGTSSGTSSVPSSGISVPSIGSSWGPLDQIDGGFYYDNLTPAQQESYELLLDGFRSHAAEITGLSEDSTEVFPAVTAIYHDHPELTWIRNGGGQLMHGTGVGTYTPDYKLTADEGAYTAEQAEAAADAFLSTIPMDASDYEKVRLVFDHLVDTIDYNGDDENCRDIYGALVERKAVCAGYAAAAKYLLERLDVPCIIVSGEAVDRGLHAWNIVWVDGEPYYMDATWGDPSFSDDAEVCEDFRDYSHLLMTTDEVLAKCVIDEEICAMPLCTSDDDYFVREGLQLTAYPGGLGDILVDSYLDGEKWITVSFDDNVVMDDVVYMLFECDEFFDFFDNANIEISSISYDTDEVYNTLTVFFRN